MATAAAAQLRALGGIVMASLVALALPGGAAANSPALAVIPFPGTPDASPASQVIFSGLPPTALTRVTARGSRSGVHGGHLTILPSGAGTAFVPSRPFAPGEQVTVVAQLRSDQAAAAAGGPASSRLRFSFGVARTAARPATRLARTSQAHSGSPRWQSYRSQPLIHPPLVLLAKDADRSSGDIFLSPVNSGQMGPMILNGQGQLVWFHHTGRATSFNFQEQRYDGQPVLTWWQGRVVGGHGADGQDVIMDSSYQTVAILHGGYGYSSDLHEFQLIPHGRALIDAYVPVQADLSSVGGPSNGWVLDCVIQELDVKTGRVLWEWHSLGHIPLSASYNGVPGDGSPFDYFHLNSIQQLPGGRLVISARNTWAVYMIDQHTGRVVWTLGGKYSSYQMGPGTNFEWQHDARMHRHGLLTLFDDGALPQEESESSAKELRVNVHTGQVSLVRQLTHSPPILAGSEGNTQVLGNGNILVGWGSGDGFSEYTPGGREVLDGRFRLGVNSYRAFRFPWTGYPSKPPSLAAVPGPRGGVKIYASWNGATQVASWQALGGNTRQDLVPLASGSAVGFETRLPVPDEPRFFSVLALDAQGHALGRSRIIRTPAHLAIFGSRAFVSASTGAGAIPVACLSRHRCDVRLSIRTTRSILGPTNTTAVPPGTGALIPFGLSRSALRRLTHRPGSQMAVQVSAQPPNGPAATGAMTLTAYSTSGPSPARSSSQSPALQLVGTSIYVSALGTGGILAACYASMPCQVKATISAGGTVIAQPGVQSLGINDLGYVNFHLTPAGQSMLSQAPGNQLAAQITLTSGSSMASGQVVLSRFG